MTSDERAQPVSRYLDYLPAIFQPDEQTEQPDFLGRFLLAFEQVLTGLGDVKNPGIEEILDGIVDESGHSRLAGVERYFDPGVNANGTFADPYHRAPSEFLEWLSGWVALSLRADLDEARQRKLIAQAASLYKLRGTKIGLIQMIKIYLPRDNQDDAGEASDRQPVVIEEPDPQTSGRPHFFEVKIRLDTAEPASIARHRRIVSAVIDQEKPAHTYYDLDVITPVLQIGVTSKIGVNTLLGPVPEERSNARTLER